jgi:hypothetical protein
MQVVPSLYYEFHIYRVVSRAGQPIMLKENVEIGPIISKESAADQVRSGKDVYTSRRRDAQKLATSIFSGDPEQDPPHQATFFQHFHPAGSHPQGAFERVGRPRALTGFGHIFFGSRGENFNP